MLGALHILAVVVLIPYLILASAFLILGDAIRSGSLWGFLDTLLMHASWIVPWGMLGAVCALLSVTVLGLVRRLRWVAALCLCVLAASALLVILLMNTASVDAGLLLFMSPCAAVMLFGGWVYDAERRSLKRRQRA